MLIDNSAWSRLVAGALQTTDEIRRWVVDDTLVASLPLLLEAGYSARSGSDHASVLEELSPLVRVDVDPVVEARALEAQGELAAKASHRLPLLDLLLAALADRHGLGILHYDSHFDFIRENTTLEYESVWLAPRGSVP